MVILKSFFFRYNEGFDRFFQEWGSMISSWLGLKRKQRKRVETDGDICINVTETKQWVSLLVIPCNPVTRLVSVSGIMLYYVSRGGSVTTYQGSHLTSQPVNHSAIRGLWWCLISQSETSMDDSWPIRRQTELAGDSLNLPSLDAGDVMTISSTCAKLMDKNQSFIRWRIISLICFMVSKFC